MSDKPPNELDRGNLSTPLFATDEKTRQQISQAASGLFQVPPAMFPNALSSLTLHPSFAAVAFQQIVNNAPRPSLFAPAPFFNVPAFPSLSQAPGAGPSVFSPQPVMKQSPATVNSSQQRVHLGPAASPGLQIRPGQPATSSNTPTVIVKQQTPGGAAAVTSQPIKVGSVTNVGNNSSNRHHHTTDIKRPTQNDMPPVVIASPVVSNSSVRVLGSSSFQPAVQNPQNVSGLQANNAGSGQTRLVAVQQQADTHKNASHGSVTSSGSRSVGMPSVNSRPQLPHQASGAVPPVIPIVKISPAGNEQPAVVQSMPNNSSKNSRNDNGGGVYYSGPTTNQVPGQSSAPKSFPVQPPANRVPWNPIVHSNYPHRSAVPIGGNGQPIVTEADLSGGQHGVSSRPGILRKRPVGEAGGIGTANQPNSNTLSPRKLTRLPAVASVPQLPSSGPQGSFLSQANQNYSSQACSQMNVSTTEPSQYPLPLLARDTSTSSITSQAGIKSEALDNNSQEPPARKKPRKQQLPPRSGPDNLMVGFDPLTTISQLPTVTSNPSHHRQKQIASSAGAGSNSASSSVSSHSNTNALPLKEETENSSTPEPEMTEDDRKLAQLAAGEINEFIDTDGVRWFSLRVGENSSGPSKSKHSKNQQASLPKLLSTYRCNWRCRNNHFERYTDVRAKDERCPALSEFCVAARSHAAREAAGWRFVQFMSLLDDQMIVETNSSEVIADLVENYRACDDKSSHNSMYASEENGHRSGGQAVSSTPLNGASRRGRGSAHRMSGSGSAARQSARNTRQQQVQMPISSANDPYTPFESTHLPDMFAELNRRLKVVSSSIQSLFSAHVPIAFDLLDRYAPLKSPHSRSRSDTSNTSNSSSAHVSSTHELDSAPLSPVDSNKLATEECLAAAVETVSEKLAEEAQHHSLIAPKEETATVSGPNSPNAEQLQFTETLANSRPEVLHESSDSQVVVLESSACVS